MNTQKMKTMYVLIALLVSAQFIMAQTLYYGWTNTGGSSGTESVNAVATDADGNVIAVGGFYGTVDFDPGLDSAMRTSSGYYDVFIAKYDASGALIWIYTFGGSSNDKANGVKTDAAGNVYVAGVFSNHVDFDQSASMDTLTEVPYYTSYSSTPYPAGDAFALKLDADGNFVWARGFGLPGCDFGSDLAVDDSGNVIMVGQASIDDQATDSFDVKPGSGTTWFKIGGGFIVKYDASGNFKWAGEMGRRIGGASTPWGYSHNIEIRSVATDANGRIYVAGSFCKDVDFDFKAGTQIRTSVGNSNTNWDGFVAKYASGGNYLSVFQVGGAQAQCHFNDIALDASNRIHLAGYMEGTIDIDPSSTVNNLTSAGATDAMILKYNASGTLIWGKLLGGTKYDVAQSLALDPSGDIYSTGLFQGRADFNPASGAYRLTAAGGDDVFISKLTNSGKFAWARQLGGVSTERGQGIAISQDENTAVYTGGYFLGTCDFNQESGYDNRTSAGRMDFFLHKLDQTGTEAMTTLGMPVQTTMAADGVSVYPNPATSTLFIHSGVPCDQIELLSADGRILRNISGAQLPKAIDIADLHSGVYFCRIHRGEEVQVHRIIKH